MDHQGGSRLTPASEKYVEAIFRLENKKGVVRITDLAIELGLKKGTVSGAAKTLRKQKIIDYAPYQSIRLTAAGRRAADKILRRNRILEQFLSQVLKIDPEISETAARRMGAAVDERVVERMLCLLKM